MSMHIAMLLSNGEYHILLFPRIYASCLQINAYLIFTLGVIHCTCKVKLMPGFKQTLCGQKGHGMHMHTYTCFNNASIITYGHGIGHWVLSSVSYKCRPVQMLTPECNNFRRVRVH